MTKTAKRFWINRMGKNKWSFRFGHAGDSVVVLSDEDIVQLRAEVDRAWDEGEQRELEEAK